MDPKGKGMVINDKEKEALYEPKDDKPTDSGSSHKKRDGKKKRRIKKIIYYDSDASSSSSTGDDDEDSSSKKKTINQNYSFDYSRIPYNSNAHLLSIPLGNPHTLMERIIHFGVIKCVVIYFPSILVFGKLLKMECISIALIIPYLLMSVGTLKLGYPLLLYKDEEPTRLSLSRVDEVLCVGLSYGPLQSQAAILGPQRRPTPPRGRV
jgi:hypothetical protein